MLLWGSACKGGIQVRMFDPRDMMTQLQVTVIRTNTSFCLPPTPAGTKLRGLKGKSITTTDACWFAPSPAPTVLVSDSKTHLGSTCRTINTVRLAHPRSRLYCRLKCPPRRPWHAAQARTVEWAGWQTPSGGRKENRVNIFNTIQHIGRTSQVTVRVTDLAGEAPLVRDRGLGHVNKGGPGMSARDTHSQYLILSQYLIFNIYF